MSGPDEEVPEEVLPDGEIDLAAVLKALTHERCELAACLLNLAEEQPEVVNAIFANGACELASVRTEHVLMPMVDIETGILDQVIATVAHNGKDAVLIHPSQVDRWHLPTDEREYNKSPHRDYWRTAKELKMDKYETAHSWVLVPASEVPEGVRVFRLKWAHSMKQDADTVMLKFAPRLCVVGTGMDSELYPSFSEVANTVSLNILGAIYATHMEDFIAQQDDDGDAFQNTITDGSDGDKPTTPMFTHQAPGFEKRGPKGEKLLCKMRTAFQGRIDSPRLYGKKAKGLLAQAGWHALLFDPEAFVYHVGPTRGTAATIPEILAALKTAEPSPPGHAPVGYGLMVRHVDDRVKIVTSQKITEYQKGVFQHVYVMKTTAWKKVLGWTSVVDKEERTLTWECPETLLAAGEKYLKSQTFAKSKHVMMPSLMQLEAEEPPDQSSPDYHGWMVMQSEFRSLQGLMIWFTMRYTQALFVTRVTGRFHANPSWAAHRHLCFALMHLIAKPYAPHFGGPECRSLEMATPIKQPVTFEDKIWHLYFMNDASMMEPLAMTGVIGMLAGAAIDSVCQRQHNLAGESHSVEIVAGGTGYTRVLLCRGVMREWGYPCADATPFMFDSATTIFVAKDESAVKRSIWIRRRSRVLTEGTEMGDINPVKVDESLNAADMHTKYLAHPVWKKHVWHAHNLTQARCDLADHRMQAARAARAA